jgi:hypothetical protein
LVFWSSPSVCGFCWACQHHGWVFLLLTAGHMTETQYLGLCVDMNLHPLLLGTNEVMGEVVNIIHVSFEGHGYHHDCRSNPLLNFLWSSILLYFRVCWFPLFHACWLVAVMLDLQYP